MYVHPRHTLTDQASLHALVDAHPLGGWVCLGRAGLIANHVPFLLDRTRGPQGTLIGHVARANPVWRELSPTTPSVVMFSGPQAYITPGWYPGRREHGEVVPTWNYVVAHVHGVAQVIDERSELLVLLERLTNAHEMNRSAPWHMSEAPAAFIERMLRAVVGIQIPIDRLEGKLKASQDEASADRVGTVLGLRAEASDQAQAMATWVEQAMQTDWPRAS